MPDKTSRPLMTPSANPPFNDSDRFRKEDDALWQFRSQSVGWGH